MAVQPDDIVRVTCKMSIGGGDIQNVYHLKNEGASAVDDATFYTSVANFMDGMYDSIKSNLTDNLLFDSIEAFNVTQNVPIDEDAWPGLTAGTDVTNDTYARQVAAVCRFPSGVAKSQGRKFFSGLSEAFVSDSGTLIGTLVTNLGLVVADLLTGFTSSGQQFDFGNWNPVLERFATWVSGIVNTYAGTQRRRSPGVGS